MTYRVIIPHSVYLELEEAASDYQLKQKNLGVRFVLNWEQTMMYLKNSPLLYQKKHKQLRTIKIYKFPYLIVFEVLADKVLVYRLIYAGKHPKKIYKR